MSSLIITLPKKSEWVMCGACGLPKQFELPENGEELTQAEFEEMLGDCYGFNIYSPCVHCGCFPEGGDDPETYVKRARKDGVVWIAEKGYSGPPNQLVREQRQALKQYADAVG